MILEAAILDVIPGKEEEFEAAQQHAELVHLFDEMLTTTVFAEKKSLVADAERFHREKIPPQVREGSLFARAPVINDSHIA